MTKRFIHYDQNGNIVKTYDKASARSVALHLAKHLNDALYIKDNHLSKLHVYSPRMRPLNESEHTPFTRRMGIEHKAAVAKIAYLKLDANSNIADVIQNFRNTN